MPKGILRVATCQFAVGPSIRRNAAQIRRQIAQAVRHRADVVHFSEAALSGYAGVEFGSWDGFDWDTLADQTRAICQLAARHRVWVILGSTHRLTGRHRPHNCLYAIDPRGRIVDRYDKRFCTRGDLRHYSPGDHCAMVTIHGVRCGLLICYDLRFPELFREYRRRGAQCLFHSFHNARAPGGPTIHTTIMRPSLQCRAASNYVWISATNSSCRYQSWPSVFIRPDGVIADHLTQHRAGVMVNTVDTTHPLYDASAPYRARSMRGVLSSGRPVRDPRSRDRQRL